jgi:hypothetical protein
MNGNPQADMVMTTYTCKPVLSQIIEDVHARVKEYSANENSNCLKRA